VNGLSPRTQLRNIKMGSDCKNKHNFLNAEIGIHIFYDICTYLSVLTGPRSSMGSPITLMIRPSVSSPTGILIGDPVSVTA
jgi:hypothetical protein